MTLEVATKVGEKAFSDKYFKWAALGVGTVAVVGGGLGVAYLWSKRPKLPDTPSGFGDLPSWLTTQQEGFGGLSPVGGLSPLLGLIEMLGLRDTLTADNLIESPEDLIRCDTGKPSMFKMLLTTLNPTAGLLYARACKKAKETKDITELEETKNRLEEMQNEFAEERQRKVDEEQENLRLMDEAWQRERERLDEDRQRLLDEIAKIREEQTVLEPIRRPGPRYPQPTVPTVPWWQEIFEDKAGMEWKDWKDQQGRQAVNDFLDPVTLGYKANNEQRMLAWYYFTKNVDLRTPEEKFGSDRPQPTGGR
jgi:hypothetical protein